MLVYLLDLISHSHRIISFRLLVCLFELCASSEFFYVSVMILDYDLLTTETQRTRRRHREIGGDGVGGSKGVEPSQAAVTVRCSAV